MAPESTKTKGEVMYLEPIDRKRLYFGGGSVGESVTQVLGGDRAQPT